MPICMHDRTGSSGEHVCGKIPSKRMTTMLSVWDTMSGESPRSKEMVYPEIVIDHLLENRLTTIN